MSLIQKHNILFKNFSYLAALQIFNVLLPLILYPYLITHIGSEKYGLVIYAQSVILYSSVIVNYGFNIFATKEVAIHWNDKNKLSSIVNTIFLIKFVLFIFALLILTILIFSIQSLKNYWYIYYLSTGMLIYEAFVPIWYFLGIEKMKYITFINITSRLILTGFIFIFVNTTGDFWKVPMFNLIGYSVGALISIYIVYKRHGITCKKPKIINIKKYMKSSFPFLLALISRDSYVRATPIIIGSFVGLVEVVYFDLGIKILSAIKSYISVISQTLYPKISREKNKYFTRKMLYYSFISVLLLTICIFFASNYIVYFFLNEYNNYASTVLNILVISSLFILISNFASQQMLIPFGYNKIFLLGIVSSMILYFIAMSFIFLTSMGNLITIALIVTLIEIYLAAYFITFATKYKII